MSSALAIASVTAVIREVVRDAFVDHGVPVLLGSADVTAVAPDRIALGDTGDVGLNVYLYGTTPNPGWRNAGLPSRNRHGDRLTNAPLALDLHYLLTAYGRQDLQAEILLGYAMQRLHEVPVLERDTIRTILADASLLSGRLADSALADQVELVKLAPAPMSTEEISKLWSGFQVSYRPTAAYVASVVLIEADEPTRTPLPVLTRGPRDAVTGEERGVVAVTGLLPPFPALTTASLPDARLAAHLGDAIGLEGHHLDGTAHTVVLSHARLDAEHSLAPDVVAPSGVGVTIPGGAPADWPAGLYGVHVALTRDGREVSTNTLALTLAPVMDVGGITVTLAPGPDGPTATIEVPVEPHVWPAQEASLVVGSREVRAEARTAVADTLTFGMEDAATGTFPIRLRVDGAESALVDRTVSPPAFDPSQQVTIP
ncbi:DUF4255 domain-containing protein [Rubrivirga marina]|uniref:Pvc16 N-terminal domain-containing protein n=1 Tax=Rubrivirga marina TaxID=1196024 RepID=A0A271IXP6_9BACT|nr:DUF4255 domain-containing protein [Rubrivirga marina]PAP76026.1 hypothetical protein BSZ37_06000 [Rubrivirga marina]